ncbi:MAG: phage terminase large subunit [Clostridia bacterium]|nr:phage terminase large subunit [Clostridia bacterium]
MSAYLFGEKHKSYMRRCFECTVNVAEGSVRAGKTVDHVFVFAALLETSPDRLHLATGATAASAKLNIGDCNGLGLEAIFGSRASWGKYRGNECMRIRTRTGEKIVIFAGGKNADSFKRIRGNSYGMWIATEINLHHDTMIKEAFNRQLAAKGRRIFWDLNPSSPDSFIYTDYIDLYAKKAERGEVGENFFNYGHFTIFDNPAVPRERVAEIVSQYDGDSVWYRRDILGERCAADGLVYPFFANNREKIVVSGVPSEDFEFINVGVDFGGSRSKTTFVATAFTHSMSLYVVAEHAVAGGKGEIDPCRVDREFEEFIKELSEKYGEACLRYAFCDSEAQYLINGLRAHARRAGLGITVGECAKRRIRDRIDCTGKLMASGRFFVKDDCLLVQKGLAEALWDRSSAVDKRLDNFTSDIDILDAMEYSFERYMTKLAGNPPADNLKGKTWTD